MNEGMPLRMEKRWPEDTATKASRASFSGSPVYGLHRMLKSRGGVGGERSRCWGEEDEGGMGDIINRKGRRDDFVPVKMLMAENGQIPIDKSIKI